MTDTIADELKECPFCGKPPTIVCPDNSYGSALITCGDANDCPVDLTAWGDLKAGETIADAVAAWNTRPTPTRGQQMTDTIADLPRLIELQRTAAPDCEREDGWNAGLDRAAAIVREALTPIADGLKACPFQERVADWMEACFTPEIIADKLERADRFIEEALELVQATGYCRDRALALVDYVFGRPAGEPFQEVGGVRVTLAALCNTHGLDETAAAEAELARIWTKIDKIRAKQATKPVGSALPVPTPNASVPAPPSTHRETRHDAGNVEARPEGMPRLP